MMFPIQIYRNRGTAKGQDSGRFMQKADEAELSWLWRYRPATVCRRAAAAEAAGAEDVLQAPPRNAIWETGLSPQHLALGRRRGLRTGGARLL